MKWCPQHFPSGTRVLISGPSASGYDAEAQDHEMVVQKVERNGPSSYLLVDANKTAVNCSHVLRVLERGTGPLIVEHEGYGPPPNVAMTIDRHQGSLLPRWWLDAQRVPRASGYFATVDLSDACYFLARGVFAAHELVFWDRLRVLLLQQTFVRKMRVDNFRFHLVHERRARALILRNRNRLLQSMKLAEIEDQELYSWNDSDWD